MSQSVNLPGQILDPQDEQQQQQQQQDQQQLEQRQSTTSVFTGTAASSSSLAHLVNPAAASDSRQLISSNSPSRHLLIDNRGSSSSPSSNTNQNTGQPDPRSTHSSSMQQQDVIAAQPAPMYAPNPQASSIQQTYQPLATVYQQSYANTVAIPESDSVCYEGMMTAIGNFFGFFGSIPCLPCGCLNPFKMVQQGSVGLVSRFGKYYRSVDPGLIFVNICSESIVTLEIKIQIEDVPRQQVMTKDNVSIFIDSVLYWHVVDPYVATFLVQDVRKALVERTMTTLRHVFGTRTLQDCIENRNTIAHEIHAVIGPAAQAWGVKIENILIKDLQFSQELQETLSSAAKQKRIGESKVIAAQAEVDSARLMREASDILNTPAAMQIRYLETLSMMARTTGAKVIFMPGADSSSFKAAISN